MGTTRILKRHKKNRQKQKEKAQFQVKGWYDNSKPIEPFVMNLIAVGLNNLVGLVNVVALWCWRSGGGGGGQTMAVVWWWWCCWRWWSGGGRGLLAVVVWRW